MSLEEANGTKHKYNIESTIVGQCVGMTVLRAGEMSKNFGKLE